MKRENRIVSKLKDWARKKMDRITLRDQMLVLWFLSALAGSYCIYLLGTGLTGESRIFQVLKTISIPSYYTKTGEPEDRKISEMSSDSSVIQSEAGIHGELLKN